MHKVASAVGHRLISLDRALAIASEVALDYREGKVRHRAAVFTTLMDKAIAEAKAAQAAGVVPAGAGAP